jgi:tetratricopeptide (TPR) repeat protein
LAKVLPIVCGFICLIVFVVSAPLSLAQTKESYEDRRAKAFALYQEGKQLQALPLFEQLAAENQYDRDVLEALGMLVLANSITIKDAEARKKERLRARSLMLKAKEQGSNSALMMAMLETVPPDGSGGGSEAFSNQKEAEEAMREAEAAFASGDMDKAFAGYQKALKADPKLYEAAVFSGDTFMQKRDYTKAAEWYAKAIAINPDRETAYRYWGTVFVRQKKIAEARDVYVEAYICEPYNRFTVNGLVQWSQLNNIRPGHPKIDIPTKVSSGDGKINITLGMGDERNDGSFAWTAYGFARALWMPGKEGLGERFKKRFPNETKYRHSLAEELDGLSAVVTVLKERMKDKDSKIKTLEPSLAILVELHDKKLLEPYILLVLADEGIAEDYRAYFKANRSKLRQYVIEYVLAN